MPGAKRSWRLALRYLFVGSLTVPLLLVDASD